MPRPPRAAGTRICRARPDNSSSSTKNTVLLAEPHGPVNLAELEDCRHPVPVLPESGHHVARDAATKDGADLIHVQVRAGLADGLQGFGKRHRRTSGTSRRTGRTSTGMPSSIDSTSFPSGSRSPTL